MQRVRNHAVACQLLDLAHVDKLHVRGVEQGTRLIHGERLHLRHGFVHQCAESFRHGHGVLHTPSDATVAQQRFDLVKAVEAPEGFAIDDHVR